MTPIWPMRSPRLGGRCPQGDPGGSVQPPAGAPPSALAPDSHGTLTPWQGRCPGEWQVSLPLRPLSHSAACRPPSPQPAGTQGLSPPSPQPGPPGRAVHGRRASCATGWTTGPRAVRGLSSHQEDIPMSGQPCLTCFALPGRPWPSPLSPVTPSQGQGSTSSIWATFHSRLSPGEAELESGFPEGLEKPPQTGLGPRSESSSVG